MAYLALYRKWRPKTFEDIVGQEHISRTLKNAIEQNRIAHAYLLCGMRGTGKTSSAKVFAKAVNCLNLENAEPCNECTNCQKINTGSSLDVFEIDAASNRGVDEIRDLREKVKFAPSEGKYKIYIIDEVHMLTTEAFNALLKTLEEPPQNVIFILATTEPHKIPLTILSRCQRFDFRPIGMDKILDRLTYICRESGLETEEEALKLIAKAAEGGMRDALSTLDQCISLGENSVSKENVNSILGIVNEDVLYDLIASILTQEVDKALEIVNQVVQEGKDIQHFTKDLIGGFRNLMIMAINQNREDLVIASAEAYEKAKLMVAGVNKNKITAIINILTDSEREMKWASQPRLMLELAIIKVCSVGERQETSFEQLLQKIEELELELASIKKQGLPQVEENKINKPLKPKPQYKNEDKVQLPDCDQAGLVEVQTLWPKVLEYLKKKDKMQIYAFLIEAKPIHFDGKTLTLIFEHAFHKEKVEMSTNQTLIEEVLSKGMKKPVSLRCLLEQQISGLNKDKAKARPNLVEDAQNFFGQDVIIQIND